MAQIVKIYIVALDPRELTLKLTCVTGFPTDNKNVSSQCNLTAHIEQGSIKTNKMK